MKRYLLAAVLIALAPLAQGADQQPAGQPAPVPSATPASTDGALLALPLGDVVGGAPNQDMPTATPPVSGAGAAKAGEALFRAMNCAYCHGLKADGVMGPDLTDGYWRYGGTPERIYKSIAEGRPEGMPSWSKVLSPTAIWEIVAYIQSLGGTYPSGNEEAAIEGDFAKGTTKPGAGLLPVTQGSY